MGIRRRLQVILCCRIPSDEGKTRIQGFRVRELEASDDPESSPLKNASKMEQGVEVVDRSDKCLNKEKEAQLAALARIQDKIQKIIERLSCKDANLAKRPWSSAMEGSESQGPKFWEDQIQAAIARLQSLSGDLAESSAPSK
ncbi:uncharacterized protein LOC112343321 [Selaginella moellendorffii]|uniref:uncharacterized protein LOC112343321 n=1 Tax=Selaginella moellendorffii TaxID=88036 RepID=UPI000D1CCFEB|nr:uncharacterized protein LOC112343321 [Selaginella moellendorffii]|eukprot:XP_024522337.1 uncharacterized protein LOC112343321 [Selaginella moellendorffii]